MFPKPKVLVVDDEPRMCDSLRFLLSRQDYEIQTATSGQEALDLLSRDTFDVAVLDLVLPDMDGHRLIDHINTHNPQTLVIAITGHATLDSAVASLRKGAYDYLRKPFEYDELLNTLKNALKHKKLKRENEVINAKFAFSEERYAYLIQNSPDIIYTLDAHGNFTFISNTVRQLLGFNVDQLIGKHYEAIIFEADRARATCCFNERRTGNRATAGIELRLKVHNSGNHESFGHNGDKHLTIELKSTGIYEKSRTEEGKTFLGTYGVARDISDRKRLETQLQHAQRMEALGALGGGIAHDFNNLLMAIQGNTSLMLLDMDATHSHYERLRNIEASIQSGAELTKQLLAFAKGGKYEVIPTNINNLIRKSSEMFERTKKEINISRKYQQDVWTLEVDQNQLEQAFLNLYVNAWQAMPGGGNLRIETENVVLDQTAVKPFQVTPGKYVKISFADSGIGMDELTLARIFEPFFTTKTMGRGTGLGLASVYGTINNHGGFIDVYSKQGKGTTFHLYLPASDKEIIETKQSSPQILNGSETLLLVDDEEVVLNVGKDLLENLGYTVLVAEGGHKALEVYKANSDNIDLVILDMIMPDMSGSETYNALKSFNPEMKSLLSSGYSLDGQANDILQRGCNGFIQKPFNIRELSHKLRQVLEN